jgi:hypothetical protein
MTCHTFDAHAAIYINIKYRTVFFTTVFWWPIMEECVFKQTYYMKVYPEVCDLSARTKNSKYYSFLPLGATILLSSE